MRGRRRPRLGSRAPHLAVLLSLVVRLAQAQQAGDLDCNGVVDASDTTAMVGAVFDHIGSCGARDANFDRTASAADLPEVLRRFEPSPVDGPEITFLGLAGASGTLLGELGRFGNTPVFFRNAGSGFKLVVEGAPGASGAALGRSTVDLARPTTPPDLQLACNRPLGDANQTVCDGGVPAVPAPHFDDSPFTAVAMNDVGCPFDVFSAAAFSCVVDRFNNPSFADPRTRLQFCAIVSRAIEFPPGDTLCSVRLRDQAGHLGALRSFMVRVEGGSTPPTFTPTSPPTATSAVTRTPTRSATPSRTPTRSATVTQTPSPTSTRVVQATATPSQTSLPFSPTPTTTVARSATPTRSVPPSLTPTQALSPTVASTSTRTPSATVRSATPTRTATPSTTPTTRPSNTPTRSASPTASFTPSSTPTRVPSATATVIPSPTRSATRTRTATWTPTRTASPTVTFTWTRSRTATPTRTATPVGPIGPRISYFGLARSDDSLVAASGTTPDGVPIFVRAAGSGFTLIVEGRPGDSGFEPGDSAFSFSVSSMPDLQILASQPLGNGSPDICDRSGSTAGGVPHVDPPTFTESLDVIAAVNDLACRFLNGAGVALGRRSSEDSCVEIPTDSGQFRFAGSGSTIQFCGLVDASYRFPEGDTRLTVRMRDILANVGIPAQIVVRVEPP